MTRATPFELRRQQIDALRNAPLPGSTAYENVRPIKVTAALSGLLVVEFLVQRFPHIDKARWIAALEENRIRKSPDAVLDSNYRVRTGERILHYIPNTIEPLVNAQIELIYEDSELVVLNKPAPLPMHSGGRYNRNTLQQLLQPIFVPELLYPVHRLDANTSGVVMFTKNPEAAQHLHNQFRLGTIKKCYLAQIQGLPEHDSFKCEEPISAEPTTTGCREVAEYGGKAASTHFSVLKRDPKLRTSLLKVTPLTGRTNQIRVHLWSLGFPICGDRSYLAKQQIGAVQTLSVEDQPMCLHAWEININHPLSGLKLIFQAALPNWVDAEVKL